MTDPREPELTLEELELVVAKDLAQRPPEPVPDAEGLPDDAKDGAVDDDGSSPNHYEGD